MNSSKKAKTSKDREELKRLVKLSRKHFEDKNLRKCIDVLHQAIALKPRNADLYHAIGWMYLFNKEPKRAMEHFQRMFEFEGNHAQAHHGIGAIRFKEGDYLTALRHFKLSLRHGLDNWEIHSCLGETYCQLGDDEKALHHVLISAKKGCPYPTCYHFLGHEFLKQKKYLEAEMYLNKAAELKKDYASAHYLLGVICARTERWDLAIKHLEKSIEFGFDRPFVRKDLGYAYAREKIFDQAENQFRKLVEANRKDSGGYHGLSLLHLEKKEWEQAETFLKKARKRGLGDEEWYTTLGSIYLEKGPVEKGVKYYKMAIQKNPDCYLAHARLGGFYNGQGDASKAIFHLEKALQLDPAGIQTAFTLGLLYARENKPKDCKRCYSRMPAVNKASPQGQQILCSYYLRQGNLKEAERTARKIVNLDKSLFAGYYLLYVIYSAKDENDRSIKYLEKALKLEPRLPARDYLLVGMAYYTKLRIQKAKAYFQKAIQIDPECGEAYSLLGIISVAYKSNYNLAQSMIELSERKPWRFVKQEDFRTVLSQAKNLVLGMISWQKDEFSLAKKHFLECAELRDPSHMTSWPKDARFLASIVAFDERFRLLRSALSFPVVMHDLGQLLDEINGITETILQETKEHTFLSLEIASAKGAIVLALMRILASHSLDGEYKDYLNIAQKRLARLRLVKSSIVFDLIETFAFEFSNVMANFKSMDKVPGGILDSLLDRFREILEHLGGKMSLEGMKGRCFTILEPYLKDFRTEMLSLRPTWAALDRLLKSQAQFTQTTVAQVTEMKEKEKVRKPTVGVFFYRTKVQITEGEMFRKPAKQYPWRLLELLLQRKRIHWTRGFLIFDKWRGDHGPKNPKKTINSYIGTLNGKTEDSLSYNKVPIKVEKDEDTGEIYLKEYDRSKLFSNIFSAEERVKKVRSRLTKDDSQELEDVKKTLVDIIDGKEGYYNCYEAYKLLIQYLEKTGFRKEDERVIMEAADFFEEKILIYEESSYAIEEYRKKIPEVEYWRGTDDAIEDMQQELEDLEKSYKIIAPHVPQKRVSREFFDIVRLIAQIKESKLSPHRLAYKQKAFGKLAHKQSMRSLCKSVALSILKDQRLRDCPQGDLQSAILVNLAKAVRRVRPRHFQSLPPLIGYLKISTEQRTKEELIEREYEIPANVQRDIRRKRKIEEELIQKSGPRIRDDEVYKKLGWSKEKQRQIRMHESSLWKMPGFNEKQYEGEIPESDV